MSLAVLKEIKLGDEIFDTAEGIQPGTELQLFKEPTIICKTIDDGQTAGRNQTRN
jgi:hypothetical protein